MREISKRVEGIDYRAIGAAGYLGLGSIWALGLSSSAALLMATPGSIPPALLKISGVIPLELTLFTWQNLVMIVVLIVLSVWICYVSTPTAERAKTAKMAGITYQETREDIGRPQTPGERLEFSPVLTVAIVALGIVYLFDVFRTKGGLAALDLNTYNFMFLIAGMLLHWRPRSFLRAAAKAVPMTGGVLLQFPLYAGIFGVLIGSGLNEVMAKLFVSISTQGTLPLILWRHLLGDPRFVPAVRRRKVGRGSSLSAGGGKSAAGQSRVDGDRLQHCSRGPAKLHQSVLDAAADGVDGGQGARSGGLFDAAADISCSGRFADALDPRENDALCTSIKLTKLCRDTSLALESRESGHEHLPEFGKLHPGATRFRIARNPGAPAPGESYGALNSRPPYLSLQRIGTDPIDSHRILLGSHHGRQRGLQRVALTVFDWSALTTLPDTIE